MGGSIFISLPLLCVCCHFASDSLYFIGLEDPTHELKLTGVDTIHIVLTHHPRILILMFQP